MSEDIKFKKRGKLGGAGKRIIIGAAGVVAVAAIAIPTAITLTGKDDAEAGIIKYNITISANIEGQDDYNISVEEGTKIGSLKTMLKAIEGYRVSGIYKDEAMQHEYLDSELIKANTKIYIRFEAITFSVKVYNEDRLTTSIPEEYELKQLDSEEDKNNPELVDTLAELKEVLFAKEVEFINAEWAEDADNYLRYKSITFNWVNERGEVVDFKNINKITEDYEIYPSFSYEFKEYQFDYSFAQSDFRNRIKISVGGEQLSLNDTFHFGSEIKIKASARHGYRVSEFLVKNGDEPAINICTEDNIVEENGELYYAYTVSESKGNLHITYNEVAKEFSLAEIPAGVTVKKNGIELSSLDKVYFGDELEVVYENFEGYYDVSFHITGAALKPYSENIYVVNSDISIEYSYKYKYAYLNFEKQTEEGYVVTGLNAADIKEVIIPNSYKGVAVTAISENAFENATITSLTIGENIKMIGREAFKGCVNLTEINYNASECNDLFNIDSQSQLPNIFLCVGNETNGTVVNIGNGVKYIPAGLFGGAIENLTDENILSNNNIVSINFGEGVKSIGYGAFAYCSNLASIIIPNSVSEIGFGAFTYCVGLSSVSLPNGLNKIDSLFSACISLKTIEIPESVSIIGENSFAHCINLESIKIPSGVKSIGVSAFEGCEKLTNVTIDSAEIYAVANETENYLLTNVTELKILTSIDDGTNLFIKQEFSKVSVDGEYNIYEKSTEITDFEFVLNDTNTYSISKYNGTDENVVIPTMYRGVEVTEIGESAFYNLKFLKSINIPETIKIINAWAFNECSGLTSVQFSEGVITIANGAFNMCTSLVEISLPATAQTLGNGAFSGCISLDNISLNEGLLSIGNDTFSGCTNLTSITFPTSLNSIGNSTFYNCTSLQSVTILNGLSTIGDFAFHKCSALLEIELPDSVNKIGVHIFDECSRLQSASFGLGLTAISEAAFSSCTSLVSLNFLGSIRTISNNAFWSCSSLESVNLPESVIRLGDSAFSECVKLSNINLPSGLTNLGIYAFYNCKKLTSIAVPSLVTKIPNSCFSRCENLSSVTLPENLKIIGEFAFWRCKALKSVSIPSTVSLLQKSAFAECSSLGGIRIPDSIAEIGEYAFNNCTSLATVNLGEKIQVIKAYAFQGCSRLNRLKITSNINSIEINAFDGCTNLKLIRIDSSTIYEAAKADHESKLFANVERVYIIKEIDIKTSHSYFRAPNFDIMSVETYNIYIDPNSYELLFSVSGDSATLTLCSSNLTDVVIPAMYNGKPVTSIQPWAFDGRVLNSVTFSENITNLTIFGFAFSYTTINELKFDGNSQSMPMDIVSRDGFFNCQIEKVIIKRELQSVDNNISMFMISSEAYILDGVKPNIPKQILDSKYSVQGYYTDGYNLYTSKKENYAQIKIPEFVIVKNNGRIVKSDYVKLGDKITITSEQDDRYKTQLFVNGTQIAEGTEIDVTEKIEITIQRQRKTYRVKYNYGENCSQYKVITYLAGEAPEFGDVSYEKNGVTYDVLMWVNAYGEEIDIYNLNSNIEIFAVYEITDEDYVIFGNFVLYRAQNGYSVTEYNGGNANEVIIPSSYNGIKIVSLGNDLFVNCNIGKLIVPGSVEYISTWTFAMANITELVFEYSDTALEFASLTRSTFFNCHIEKIIFSGGRTINWVEINTNAGTVGQIIYE